MRRAREGKGRGGNILIISSAIVSDEAYTGFS